MAHIMSNMQLAKLGRNPHLWLALIVLLWLPINLYSLMSYPAPTSDDAWFGSTGVQFMETGAFNAPILSNDIYDSLWRLYSVGLALFCRVFGVGLAQARLFSVIGAMLGAGVLFSLGRTLYQPVVGLLAAALYLFSLWVLGASHTVRPDLWVNAAAVSLFLGFWFAKQSRRASHALLLGFFIAAAVDIYITVVYSSIAISIAVLVEFRQRADLKVLGAFILGGLAGTLYWFLVRLFPDPLTTIAQWQFMIGDLIQFRPTSSVMDTLLGLVNGSVYVVRHGLIGHSSLGPLEFIYMSIGLICLAIRRQSQDKLILFGWAVQWLGLFLPFKTLQHVIEVIPLLSLAIAVGTVSLAQWLAGHTPLRKLSWPVIACAVCAPLAAGYFAGNVVLGWRSRVIDYEQYSGQLRALIPLHSNVIGESTWWWALRDGIFTYDYYLSLYGLQHPDLTAPEIVADVIKTRKVDAILLDERLSSWMATDAVNDRNLQIGVALADYAQVNCQFAGAVEGYAYGVEQGGPAIKRTEVFTCPTTK